MPYLAMEWKRILRILQLAVVIAVLIDRAAFQIAASDDVVFYEPFDDSFEGSWIASERDDYKGVWKLSKSEGHDDYGLLVSEKARKYAIVKELGEIFNFKDGKVVLQFEVRLQNDLECGGAYLKYLRPLQDSWDPKNFDNNHPYSIMFGPDKCGSTNKVHFILNHRNLKTGKYVEHHLKYPPPLPSDKLTHVYTAALRPGNQLSILIDGKEKKKANFLSGEDFEPALVPSKMITDPNDKKPDDWDEQEKVPDSTAVKPDDWDEDAPMEIIDEAAEKPQGWLDKETEEIDDPQAVKPEDWDDEEDGEWEPPKMQNPKCVFAPGCGVWKKPMKRNPAYKGKWKAPLIDNPNYKGVWKPRQIPNPDYYELDKPDFEPVAAIGIEIWTMQDGILFDNILITREEKVADTYRERTWKPKYEAEKKQQKAQEAGSGLAGIVSSFQEMLQKKIFDLLYKLAEIPLLDAYKPKIIELIEKGNKQPHITIGVLASVVVVTLTAFFRLLFGDKKPNVVNKGKNKVVDAVSSNNQRSRGIKEKKAPSSNNQSEKEAKEKEPENEDAIAPRRRRSARRET